MSCSYHLLHNYFTSCSSLLQVLADNMLSRDQLQALLGPDLSFMELPLRASLESLLAEADYDAGKKAQWQKDSGRMELLLNCRFPTLQVFGETRNVALYIVNRFVNREANLAGNSLSTCPHSEECVQ